MPVTLVTAKIQKLLLHVRTRVRARGEDYRYFYIPFFLIVHLHLECCNLPCIRLLKNDTLFSLKRHVVFDKTIRCFQQNKPLFVMLFRKVLRSD